MSHSTSRFACNTAVSRKSSRRPDFAAIPSMMDWEQGGSMKALRNLTVLALVALAAAACTTVPETSLITGSLSYRGQPRVPPGATADVTLFEQGREAQPVITQQSMPAGDGRAPLRFDLRVGNEQINQPTRRYAVRGSVRDGAGTVLFVT